MSRRWCREGDDAVKVGWWWQTSEGDVVKVMMLWRWDGDGRLVKVMAYIPRWWCEGGRVKIGISGIGHGDGADVLVMVVVAAVALLVVVAAVALLVVVAAVALLVVVVRKWERKGWKRKK